MIAHEIFPPAKCSFCRKNTLQVHQMIQSWFEPSARICDECVQLCLAEMEKRARPMSLPAPYEKKSESGGEEK